MASTSKKGASGLGVLKYLSNKAGKIHVKSIMSSPLWAFICALIALVGAGAFPQFDPLTRHVLQVIALGCFCWSVYAFFHFGKIDPKLLQSEAFQIKHYQETLKMEQQNHSSPISKTLPIANPALEHYPMEQPADVKLSEQADFLEHHLVENPGTADSAQAQVIDAPMPSDDERTRMESAE